MGEERVIRVFGESKEENEKSFLILGNKKSQHFRLAFFEDVSLTVIR
jgi:hypothetical protein